MPCWMLRRTSFAGQHGTNVAKLGRIPALAAMNGRCRPAPARLITQVPKLRRQTFETAIIEHYRRRESSVEEALIEMYLAGISVRRVEDITEALGHAREPEYGVEPQQEDLRQDPDLAEPAHRRRASLFSISTAS